MATFGPTSCAACRLSFPPLSDPIPSHRIPYTMTLYNIVRFYAPHINKPNRTILKGLSLEQAQQHCRDPKTRKDGEWFDGFAEANS